MCLNVFDTQKDFSQKITWITFIAWNYKYPTFIPHKMNQFFIYIFVKLVLWLTKVRLDFYGKNLSYAATEISFIKDFRLRQDLHLLINPFFSWKWLLLCQNLLKNKPCCNLLSNMSLHSDFLLIFFDDKKQPSRDVL